MAFEREAAKCPELCRTCKHLKIKEVGEVSVFVGIPNYYCRKFVSLDCRSDKKKMLPCQTAFKKFCNGSFYRPNFWEKIKRLSWR